MDRTDLKLSSGMQNDSDVEAVFRSLKESAGGNPQDLHLTYEEFCNGIMDFPFLLDQFKQEFQTQSTNGDACYEDLNSPASYQNYSELSFLPSKLKDAISLYNKALNIDEIYLETSNCEDLFEALRLSLIKLKEKYKDDISGNNNIVNGSIDLYLLVRDLSRYHEEATSELQAEIYENNAKIENLSLKCQRLKESNENLLYQVSAIESKAEMTFNAHIETLEVKKQLEFRLEAAEDLENNYHQYLQKIEEIIMSKEKTILQLTKELRQLNSFKTLQEMRGTNGRTTEDMKINKLAQIKYRQSVPIRDISPQRSVIPLINPMNDFKVQVISDQLRRKKEEIDLKTTELDKLEYTTNKYYEEIIKLRQENASLHVKLRCMQFEYANKRSEDRESLMPPSLFDEFQNLKDGSVVETAYQKSISYHNFEIKHTPKETYSFLDASTQTSDYVKDKKKKNSYDC